MPIDCYAFNLYVSSEQVFSSEQDARTTKHLFFICNSYNLLSIIIRPEALAYISFHREDAVDRLSLHSSPLLKNPLIDPHLDRLVQNKQVVGFLVQNKLT